MKKLSAKEPAKNTALDPPPNIDSWDIDVKMLLKIEKPTPISMTKNNASTLSLYCAENACLAYALISCLGLMVIFIPFLSLLARHYIKDRVICQ